MEKIEDRKINFDRKNLLVWIGSLNEKLTVWIGTENDNETIEYKTDLENRELAIDYISSTLKKLSENDGKENNLQDEDIKTINSFLEKGENVLKTKDILKN